MFIFQTQTGGTKVSKIEYEKVQRETVINQLKEKIERFKKENKAYGLSNDRMEEWYLAEKTLKELQEEQKLLHNPDKLKEFTDVLKNR